MKLLFLSSLTLAGVATMLMAACIIGIAKIVATYKERDRLKVEVRELHRRADRVSGDYLDHLAALREENSRIKQNANVDGWVSRAVLDDYEKVIDDYMKEIAYLKKQIANKDKLLAGADNEIARLRSKKGKEVTA